MTRVAVTGVGVVTGGVTGGWERVSAYLHDRACGAPGSVVAGSASPAFPAGGLSEVRVVAKPATTVEPAALAALIDEGEARRLSRVCQLAVAAGRIALADAGLDAAGGLGLVIGTEFGDLRSTIGFVDGYLSRGPQGLSALLFPNTVMNTMAATTAIAVRARELSLTLNAPTVAGELAIARAAAAVRSGRVDAALAGGVDELNPLLTAVLDEMGGGTEARGEGAGFVVLESLPAARARGARILGEIAGAAWRALAARPYGIGRGTDSRAIAAALEEAATKPSAIGRVHVSANGDAPRDRWEEALLDAALAPHRPPRAPVSALGGRHSGIAALSLAAALRSARDGAPALVHAVARGGTHVAMVVRTLA